MIRQCCQCKKIEIDGRWIYPRFSQLTGQDISHGYCDECLKAFKKQLQHHLRGSSSWKSWVQRFL